MAEKVIKFSPSFWSNYLPEPYSGSIVLIQTQSDGSCYFHSIAASYSVAYLTESLEGRPISRKEFVRKMRDELADSLSEYYDRLSKGKLRSLSKSIPSVSYEELKKLLLSNNSVGFEVHEYVSDILDKDIYILDKSRKSLYPIGKGDDSLYYKGRNSIIIMYTPPSQRVDGSVGHFELIGLKEQDSIMTLFPPNHPLIVHIRESIKS